MTNTSRNTLVLSSLLIMSGMIGFFILRSAKQDLNQKKAANDAISQEAANFSKLVSNRDNLESEHAKYQAMAGSHAKILFNRDSSIITYDYLLKLLKLLGRDIEYDFGMSAKSEGNYNEYVISGQSHYMDLVRFTRQLEYQRPVLTVEDISISSESARSDTVNFSMMFRTHFKEGGLSPEEISYKSVSKPVQAFDLFRARYTEEIQDYDEDPRLVNLDNNTLIAISDKRAFLRDNRGIIRILKEGDKVLWGRLYKIDSREQMAVFKINKYGFEENQTLYMNNEN
ncbi:MAG: hypothetical protein M0R50_08985 [Candidatus Cloacimonetes bacterium]|nr:hypothetical protein [Candidatus Cloacimonadota bacterium]